MIPEKEQIKEEKENYKKRKNNNNYKNRFPKKTPQPGNAIIFF